MIDAKAKKFTGAADEIWETPETRFAVEQSVQPFYRISEEEVFSIEKGVAHMEHAFVATYGSGKPVIGILAEYDALANLSQVAALMTETGLMIEFDSACYNYLPNHVTTSTMYENLTAYGSLDLTDEEQAYGSRYYETLTSEAKEGLINRAAAIGHSLSEEEIQHLGTLPISEQVAPLVFSDATNGSTDVGDVSWICPAAQVLIGCEPQGTPPHSWQ